MVATAEEVDAIERSRKKLRTKDESEKFQTLSPRVEDWMEDDEMVEEATKVEEKGPRSYKQACMNDFVSDDEIDGTDEDWWSEGRWESRVTVEETELGPNIKLKPEFQSALTKKWRRTLIVTVLGRVVREGTLSVKLHHLWGDVQVIDIGANFYLVKCKNEEVYDLALTGGPWLMYDHYISVQPWKADFDPDGEKISSVAAWVRIAKLPMDYYEKGILYVIGSQIGEVLKLDANTMKKSKGRFARICVRLDLQKPLRPYVLINGKVKKVEYEGLHAICFKCGKYGHMTEQCSHTTSVPKHSVQPEFPSVGKGNLSHVNKGVVRSEEGATEFGSWMVVHRPWKGRRPVGDDNKIRDRRSHREVEVGKSGSRFSALHEEIDDAPVDAINEVAKVGANLGVVLKDVVNVPKTSKNTKTRVPRKEDKQLKLLNKPTETNPMDYYLKKKASLDVGEAGPSMVTDLTVSKGKHNANMEMEESALTVISSSLAKDVSGLPGTGDGNPIDPGSFPRGQTNKSSLQLPNASNHDDLLQDPFLLEMD